MLGSAFDYDGDSRVSIAISIAGHGSGSAGLANRNPTGPLAISGYCARKARHTWQAPERAPNPILRSDCLQPSDECAGCRTWHGGMG